MNYTELAKDAPMISVATILFLFLFVYFFVLCFVSTYFRSKNTKRRGLHSVLMTFSFIMALVMFPLTIVSTFASNEEVRDKAFHEKLLSDYGLQTESNVSDVMAAAKEGRIVVMSDDTGELDVSPRLEGDILTFTKLAKGEPINPRT